MDDIFFNEFFVCKPYLLKLIDIKNIELVCIL